MNYAVARAGVRDIRYLDDFFLIGGSRSDTAQQLATAQSVITSFGLIINPDKTEGPLQSLSFLGVQLDSVAQTVSCTPAQVAELTALLRSLRQQRVITRAHAESLIGKLSFAARVLPGARPFMRRMLDAVRACKSRRGSTPIHIDPGFRAEVRFWLQHFSSWKRQTAVALIASFALLSSPQTPASTASASTSSPHQRLSARSTLERGPNTSG